MLPNSFAAGAPHAAFTTRRSPHGGASMLLVASGKGGVGTSMIATLMALTASERGENVLLVDATESGGTLHHMFGVRPTHSLWMLAAPGARPDEALIALDARL